MKKKIALWSLRAVFTVLMIFNLMAWPAMISDIRKHKRKVAVAQQEAKTLCHPEARYRVVEISAPGNGLHSDNVFIRLRGVWPGAPFLGENAVAFRLYDRWPSSTKWASVQEGDSIGLDYFPKANREVADHTSPYLAPRRL